MFLRYLNTQKLLLMKLFKKTMLFLVMIVTIQLFAQSKTVISASSNEEIDLILVYEQYVKDGYGTPAIYEKLANEYYFKSNYSEAKKWFEMLFKMETPINKKHLKRYRQSLRALKIDTKNNQYLSSVVEKN